MNEDQLFGLAGIDTDEERRRINYDPDTAYHPDRDRIGIFTDDEEDDVPLIEESGEEWVEQLLVLEDRLEGVNSSIASLEKDTLEMIEENETLFTNSHTGKIPGLTTMDFEIPQEDLDRFMDMGYDKPFISFYEYKEAIHSTDRTPIQDLIVEVIEFFASDIYGNIELELYPDIVEIQQFAEELGYLYQHLIGQSYGTKKEMEEKEKVFSQLIVDHETDESLYYEMLRENFESEDYFQAAEKYEYSKREVESKLRERKQVQESVQLINTALSSLINNAEQILEGLASTSQINPEQVKVLLSKQQNHPRIEVDRNLALSLALKLSLNHYNESVHQKKNTLRNTAAIPVVKRMHDKLIQRKETRNVVMTYVQDQLHYLKEPSSQRSVELFLNEISRGVQYMTKEYETMMQDTYRLHALTNDVRKEKLELIINKEHARASYLIV